MRQCCGPQRGFIIHITDNSQQVCLFSVRCTSASLLNCHTTSPKMSQPTSVITKFCHVAIVTHPNLVTLRFISHPKSNAFSFLINILLRHIIIGMHSLTPFSYHTLLLSHPFTVTPFNCRTLLSHPFLSPPYSLSLHIFCDSVTRTPSSVTASFSHISSITQSHFMTVIILFCSIPRLSYLIPSLQ